MTIFWVLSTLFLCFLFKSNFMMDPVTFLFPLPLKYWRCTGAEITNTSLLPRIRFFRYFYIIRSCIRIRPDTQYSYFSFSLGLGSQILLAIKFSLISYKTPAWLGNVQLLYQPSLYWWNTWTKENWINDYRGALKMETNLWASSVQKFWTCLFYT